MSFKREFECPTGWCDCDRCATMKGLEDDGTVICGRRPKQFKCPECGSQNFTLARRVLTEVDFSCEGAVEGHPFLRNVSKVFDGFVCSGCGEDVPEEQAQEMFQEVM